LGHKALHWPGAGFAESADSASPGDVIGNLQQVIGVIFSAMTMRESMQGFGHPERAFTARSALTARFVRVEFSDVGQGLDNISGVVQHDDCARTRHTASGDERIEI